MMGSSAFEAGPCVPLLAGHLISKLQLKVCWQFKLKLMCLLSYYRRLSSLVLINKFELGDKCLNIRLLCSVQ